MALNDWSDGWVVVPAVRGATETAYGVLTHYVVAGNGPPVICVHGGGPGAAGRTSWTNTMQALAPHFRVYAIDLIGAGYSGKPNMEYTFQTLVDHLAGFVDALNLKDVRLIGNSQGSYVAIKYALDYPGKVKQAALISTGTLATACGIDDQGKRTPLPRFDGTRKSLKDFMALIVNDAERLTDELIDARLVVASLPGHKEMLDSLNEHRRRMREDSSHRQVYDCRHRLPLLKVPFNFIWGEHDHTAPLDPLGIGLQKLCPNAPFHVVKGSGHQVQNDKPQECNRILLEFFGIA